VKISILGATGAMGGLVTKAALQDGVVVENKVSSRDRIESLFKNTDGVVDFSCPMATDSMLRYVRDNQLGIPIVIGTTGLSQAHLDLIEECSKSAPIFFTSNMSSLVSMLNIVVYVMAKLLGENHDVEILEIHHRLKKDAPSGTALMLGKTIAKARNREFMDIANFIRYGIIEQRKSGEIGFSVQRCSNVVGTHEISFMNELESIKIRHEAHSKEVFAKGAIRAVKWIIGRSNGIYTMDDLIKETVTSTLKSIYEEFLCNQ
jgi:4-hydroxy-tetrahydrodipicolinate reductase